MTTTNVTTSVANPRRIPPWVAAAADLAVVLAFVAIGRRTHDEDAGLAGFFRVLWPFAIGLAVAWGATALHRAPLARRRVVTAWLLTAGIGIGLRIAVQGHEFKVAFTIVTLVFLGVCMSGWRAAFIETRSRRRRHRVTT